MANYEEARVKRANTQLNKLKNFQDEDLSHELLLKKQNKTKN